jgi:UDP-glucose 4-epimerase
MRILVTGGAGFIGSHVADRYVADGHEVAVLDDLSTGRRENVNDGARLVEADLAAAAEAFADARPEVCFHLAAQADVRVSVERPDFDAEVNLLGTIHVLEAARGHGVQVVFASSGGAIYGECDGPAAEDAPLLPLAPYGASKLAAEEYLETYNRLYEIGHVALRYGNVYGPRQDPHGEAGVVAIFLGRLAHAQPLRIFGDGRQARDYVYVGDIVEATLAAQGHAGVYNVGTGTETSVLDLAEACQRVAGISVETEHAPARPGELQRSVVDPGRAQRELGFRAKTSLEDGLAATWEFVREAEGEDAVGAN